MEKLTFNIIVFCDSLTSPRRWYTRRSTPLNIVWAVSLILRPIYVCGRSVWHTPVSACCCRFLADRTATQYDRLLAW